MRPLRYSINVTLDGCCDHRAMSADEDLHRHAAETLAEADALLFGRVTYEMMEAAWRPAARTGARPDWMEPFARTIDAAKKYVVSSTLDQVDWNAEIVRGDHSGKAVQQLKQELGRGLLVGGLKLPLALAELGLIDEYEFVVQPRLAGHGPTLFAGLSKPIDLKLVSRQEFGSGAVAMRYEPKVTAPARSQFRKEQPMQYNHAGIYPSRRSPVFARNVVSTSQPLATQAGLWALTQGGNAMDAALAAAITLTVVEPTGNGLGSDAFCIVWDGQQPAWAERLGPLAGRVDARAVRGAQEFSAARLGERHRAWRGVRLGRPFEAFRPPALRTSVRAGDRLCGEWLRGFAGHRGAMGARRGGLAR